MYITATRVYYSQGPHGPVQHTKDHYVFIDKEDFQRQVKNADMIDLKTVNHICLDTDAGIVFQASGYSWNRGSFVDVFPYDSLKKYL